MKKFVLLLAAIVAFAFAAVAQTSGGTSSSTTGTSGDQATSGTKAKKGKKAAAAGGEESAAAEHKEHAGKSAGKGSQLTGCLAAGDSDNEFKLTNGRYKKGLEVEPASGTDLKAHVGHKVKLTGTWAKGTGSATEKAEGAHKHFVASNVTHVSDTCTATASAGAGGAAKGKKKEGGKAESKTPPGF